MDYNQFVKDVQQKAGCQEKGAAVKAIQATFQTLSERLTKEEAGQLAAQLPRELQRYLEEPQDRGRFKFDEFLQRVGRREGIDVKLAGQHARAVVEVLCSAVSRGEIDQVVSQLPKDFWPLFGKQSETVH